MYRTRKVAVVVPAFNEQAHISSTLCGIPAFVDVVYVVDDASTDCTADIVRASRGFASDGLQDQGSSSLSSEVWLGTRNSELRTREPRREAAGSHTAPVGSGGRHAVDGMPLLSVRSSEPETRNSELSGARSRVQLVTHRVNAGVGAAIATGYMCALRDGVDIAAVMAGDDQMDPAELTRLLDPIVDGNADYTKGDRTSCREHLIGMPPLRRAGNRLLRWFTCIAVGNMQVRDPQNGYTAASGALIMSLPLLRLYPRYGYCNQLLCWISLRHKRVVEVRMPSRYQGEKSKIRYRTYIPKLLWLLTRLTVARLVWRGGRGCEWPDTVGAPVARRTGTPGHVSALASSACSPEFILVRDIRSRE